MKTNPNKTPAVNVITMGCAKNLVDSENLITQLQGNKLHTAHNGNKNSDIVIVNTCGFIDAAKEESVNMILDLVEQKKNDDIQKIIVTGCLSERYKGDLITEIPEVDAYFGTNSLQDIMKYLELDYKHNLIGERIITTKSHTAFLKIAEGCNRPCSFCAIPLMRGKHQSRTIEFLVQEAKFLVSKGVKELVLIAQDLTYYGLDIYGKRRLDDLLKSLSDIEGLQWIRLLYAYPTQFPKEILPVIRERDNICNYLDMPLQHASSKVLKSMRRGITRQRTEELLAHIREEIPGITLRTSFIVGYPDETEEDFAELIDFIKQQKFDRVGVFTYSDEENTHAGNLEDIWSTEEKEERRAILMETQQEISFTLNQTKIGKTYKVLVDRIDGDLAYARTESDAPEVDNEVVISHNGEVKVGEFYEVSITDALEFDLFGELI